jgi:hypothetical protein
MSPAERLRNQPAAVPLDLQTTEPATVAGPLPRFEPLPVGLVGQVAWRGLRYRRWVETHWYHCLLLPARAGRLVFGLAFGLTLFTGVCALVVPDLLRAWRGDDSWLPWLRWPCLCLPLLVFGYGSGFLDCVFASARAGEIGYVRWPGRDINLALASGVRWLICFLAGPVVPAGAGLLYWVYGGELVFWDWLILIELNLVALATWLLLLLAVNQHDGLRGLHPARVVEPIRRLGPRLPAWAVLASVLGLAHAWWAGVALAEVHHEPAWGWFLLSLCCASGMFVATFLFRWVGIWFYWQCLGGTPVRS